MDFPPSIGAGRVAEGLAARLASRTASEGQITFPAVPALADDYTEKCIQVFAGLGRVFNDAERAHLRSVLDRQLADAFSRSQRSTITVAYRSPVFNSLSYEVTVWAPTVDEVHQDSGCHPYSTAVRVEPDARVGRWPGNPPIPRTVGCSTSVRGPAATLSRWHAGTSRRRRGDDREVADLLREGAQRDSLDIRVINRDVFETDADLRTDYRIILLSEVVSDFRDPAQLRDLFTLAARCLATVRDTLVFNIFLARPSYFPR